MLKILTVLFALLFVSTYSYASDPGFYTGIGYGVAYYKNNIIDEKILLSPAKQNDISAGYIELYAGYSFNDYISLEVGYSNFSDFDHEYSIKSDLAYFDSPNTNEKIDMQIFSVGAVLEYPLFEQFSILGSIGYSYYDIDGNWSGGFSESGGDPSWSYSTTENDMYFGLGCKYDITETFSSRLKWTSSDTNDFDISALNFSVEMGF